MIMNISRNRIAHSPRMPMVRRRGQAPAFSGTRQRGVALVIALLLLVVITLVGFSAVRSTIVQQKLSSNMYDREVAFQNAEAAMRAAADLVASNPGMIARNCQAGGVVCMANPFADPNFQSSWVHTIQAGQSPGQYKAGAAAAGQPQFIIESLGNWVSSSSGTGFNQTANAHNYGAQGLSSTAVFYRITARSGDPTSPDMQNRAVVTLQSVIKQG
jgi:type IV pilus assembly protein PilX